jgi:anti-sigma-K factor RskA
MMTFAEQLVTLWRVLPDQAPRNAKRTIQAWLRRFDELAAAHDETPVDPERLQRIREGLLRHGRAITTKELGR